MSFVLLILPLNRFGLEHPRPHAERVEPIKFFKSENPNTVARVHSILENHPWYETRWKAQLEKLPNREHDEMLFMLAVHWRG